MSLTTRKMSFAIGAEGFLLDVNAGTPAVEALSLASDLAEGIQLFAERLREAIDDGGYVNQTELRSIGFLAETASILSRSVLNQLSSTGVPHEQD